MQCSERFVTLFAEVMSLFVEVSILKKKPFIFAICGAKNTGKTTLITQLIGAFTARGLKVATIKHDGHDFSADVPNTDTYRHMAAGAYGTAVFSDNKFMVVKVQPKTPVGEMAALFPEADIILVEGCKSSAYPKMQMLHSGEEEHLHCNQLNFVGYIADGTMDIEGVPCYHRNDVEGIAEAILTEKFIRTELSMIVLAGGKSQRMGRDKADLPYGETTFLEHQIAKGRALGIENVLVSGYRGEKCSAEVVGDVLLERGPLSGLAATLPQVEHEHCLVLSVDMPQLPLSVLRKLIAHSRGSDCAVTILRHGTKFEPLVAVYNRSAAAAAEELLRRGRGAVMALLEEVGYEEYLCPEDEAAFQNVNTMDDYEAMKQ